MKCKNCDSELEREKKADWSALGYTEWKAYFCLECDRFFYYHCEDHLSEIELKTKGD